jgi:hypothetical protein
MKRTEIIIETRRITVIKRRSSIDSGYDRSPADMQIIDAVEGRANGEISNNGIEGEENQPCTDSRDRSSH